MEHNENIRRNLSFEFKGEGFEYFKIWIVNILLTLLTLGIYSAWAKVRTNRYFYANTFLDNDHFQYLAEPLTILKGRIIAVIAFFVYSYLVQAYPYFAMAFAIILFFTIPFFVNQSIAFNHRMTAYKNIQFRFKASYGEAFKVVYIWPLLSIITLGIMYPQALRKTHLYKACNSSYGTTSFEYNATYKDYGQYFLVAIGIILLFSIPSWLIHSYAPSIGFITPVMFAVVYAFIVAYLIVNITNFFFSRLTIDEHRFKAHFQIGSFLQLMLSNLFFIVISLGLYLPVAKVRLTQYLCSHLTFDVLGSLDTFVAAEKQNITALGEEFGEVFDFQI